MQYERCLFLSLVWAESGDFRDNTHHPMSMDHNQVTFTSARSRNRDRKGESVPLWWYCWHVLSISVSVQLMFTRITGEQCGIIRFFSLRGTNFNRFFMKFVQNTYRDYLTRRVNHFNVRIYMECDLQKYSLQN